MARLNWRTELRIGMRIAGLLVVLAGELGLNLCRALLFGLRRRRVRAAIREVMTEY